MVTAGDVITSRTNMLSPPFRRGRVADHLRTLRASLRAASLDRAFSRDEARAPAFPHDRDGALAQRRDLLRQILVLGCGGLAQDENLRSLTGVREGGDEGPGLDGDDDVRTGTDARSESVGDSDEQSAPYLSQLLRRHLLQGLIWTLARVVNMNHVELRMSARGSFRRPEQRGRSGRGVVDANDDAVTRGDPRVAIIAS